MGIYRYRCDDCEHEWEDTAVEKCPVCGSVRLQAVELPSNRLQDEVRLHDGDTMKINNGDIVTVNKGSVVKSYNPSKSEYILKRSQRVKVNHQYSAVFKWDGGERICITESSIVWAGTGGYWCWTDKSNVMEVKNEINT